MWIPVWLDLREVSDSPMDKFIVMLDKVEHHYGRVISVLFYQVDRRCQTKWMRLELKAVQKYENLEGNMGTLVFNVISLQGIVVAFQNHRIIRDRLDSLNLLAVTV